MALSMTPFAIIVAFFSKEILYFWTQSAQTADQGHWVLCALVLAALMGATVWLPYGLQLAHQWVGLTLRLNAACVLVMGPLVYELTSKFGVIGGAIGWLVFNFAYVLLSGILSLKRLLPRELWGWFLRALVLPVFVSSLVCFVFSLLSSGRLSDLRGTSLLLVLALIWLISSGLTLMVLPDVRKDAFSRLSKYRSAVP